ncbi:hypothetical protein OH76DRAFT_883091 [Lentinus brumalis]|uniref:Uncharacterized protein n=1 Tax=Lentinus brumalis TaxID=2498619 RepID=A0A371DRT9_9APHY|nr:hypothetical protein OH76DRAFT_883091 [Polyporus brumalis]
MLTLLTATNTLLPFHSLRSTSAYRDSCSCSKQFGCCQDFWRHILYQLVPVHYAWISYRLSPLRAERPVQGFPCLVAAVRVPWDLRRSSMATSLPQQFMTSSQAVVPPGKQIRRRRGAPCIALVLVRRLWTDTRNSRSSYIIMASPFRLQRHRTFAGRRHNPTVGRSRDPITVSNMCLWRSCH